ncbi:glycosyltransferase family 2 protein [Formosa sp. L2A11]|uniref:glycosyltransferase family 2 protein n=1 Tax=Formosa sp. L2A11 TaxID=2686363 RepID=UPI00131BE98E|nr:glycosyltransferase family 2 protein [Formosa sp. L2A11]
MLSVLVPIYNYSVVHLVTTLHKQLTACNIPFEILCLDDGSDKEYVLKNKVIESLIHTSFFKSEENKGRTETRQRLSYASKFDWLLFLDSDTLPKNNTFIANYISHLNTDIDAIFGGITYKDTPPKPEFLLRWKYGIKYESQTAETRKPLPFKNIVSANMCMRKHVFNAINTNITYNAYGLDNYFGSKLKENKAKILHINNPVYHLGLESNNVYLLKKEEATQTLLKLIRENLIKNKDNKILCLFQLLKKTHLNHLFSYIYKTSHPAIKKQLTSENPSISLFQFYRIAYMCYVDKKTK